MKPDKALIEKFYKGTCTPEERAVVMNWLLEHEEEKEEVAEWENTSWKGTYPEAYADEMLADIKANTFGGDVRVRRIPWRSLAVAASILLVTGIFLWSYLLSASKHRNTTGIAIQQVAPAKLDTPWFVYKAPSEQWVFFEMPDGSVARLFPGAEIRFDSTAYGVISRDVFLEGIAEFNVAQTAGKPFSVMADGFKTIALGTKFMVASEKGNILLVRLYSGKVVVKKIDNKVFATKDIYLEPGQEWRYYLATHKHMLTDLGEKASTPQDHLKSNAIQVHEDNIVFENAPLNEVLDFLQQQYHVTIHYQKKDFKDVYFSGKMLPQDSLKMVLDNIARVNELKLIANGEEFTIR